MKEIDIIQRPNCKLCNSEKRIEAENMYESRKSILQIHKWISQYEEVSYPAVRNHLENHYVKQKNEILIKEYKEDVKKYAEEHKDKIQSLLHRKAIFEKTLYEMSAKNELITEVEQQRKNANSLKSLNDSIIAIENQIDNIQKRIEPVIIILEKLRSIVSDKMQENISNDCKEILIEVISKLEEEADNLFVEEHSGG